MLVHVCSLRLFFFKLCLLKSTAQVLKCYQQHRRSEREKMEICACQSKEQQFDFGHHMLVHHKIQLIHNDTMSK